MAMSVWDFYSGGEISKVPSLFPSYCAEVCLSFCSQKSNDRTIRLVGPRQKGVELAEAQMQKSEINEFWMEVIVAN